MKPVAVLWFRNDLRLHDHEALVTAIQNGYSVLPVFIWDSRWQSQSPSGFIRMGSHRRRFLAESLLDIRRYLVKMGSNLLIRSGHPAELIPQICKEFNAEALYFHSIPASEEQTDEQLIRQELSPKLSIHSFLSQSLIHPNDLPISVPDLPDQFTEFRKLVEANLVIRPMFSMPEHFDSPVVTTWGEIPLRETVVKTRFSGGMTTACHRIDDYIWRGDFLKMYKETRNGLLGMDYSSKFSPWLAWGCMSPRQALSSVKRYEKERIQNESTTWLVFELLWRDFFYFKGMKYGNQFFRKEGIRKKNINTEMDFRKLTRWVEGQTGYLFVDAAMRELASTGFLSNRMRQITASFLIHELNCDWRMGAEWFESQLIDYDPYSNYGNWQYIAGVGFDPRPDRKFDIFKQGKTYDPEARYIHHWIPESRSLDASLLHTPQAWKLIPGYPQPVIDIPADSLP